MTCQNKVKKAWLPTTPVHRFIDSKGAFPPFDQSKRQNLGLIIETFIKESKLYNHVPYISYAKLFS